MLRRIRNCTHIIVCRRQKSHNHRGEVIDAEKFFETLRRQTRSFSWNRELWDIDFDVSVTVDHGWGRLEEIRGLITLDELHDNPRLVRENPTLRTTPKLLFDKLYTEQDRASFLKEIPAKKIVANSIRVKKPRILRCLTEV